LAAVELPGQQVAAAVSALQTVQHGQAPVLTDLITNYSTALATLVSDITINQNNFPTQNQYPPYGNWKGYSAFAGPEQAPPGGVDPQQQINSIPDCGTQTADVSFAPTAWEPGVSLPDSWFLLAALGQNINGTFSPTATPLCVASFTRTLYFVCNPKTGCTPYYSESGSLNVQFEGTDGTLHTMETLQTPVGDCPLSVPGCGVASIYFGGSITAAGSLTQFLIKCGGQSVSPDTSVLDNEDNQILAKEQNEVYQWDADSLTNPKLPGYATLSSDMNSLAGAFELLQATAQTIAPSASLGNQALSDILYGQDQLASYTSAPNNPVAVFQALANGTGTTTLADWDNIQSSRLALAQALLNGYLNSASSAGNLTTAEAPGLTLSVLDQLQTGLQIGLSYKAPAITSAASVTFTTGKAGSFQVTATGQPAPTFTETGALPAGVTFTSAGRLSGTPAPRSGTSPGSGGVYPLTITASNGIGTAATQNFTLTVNQPPTITAPSSVTYRRGQTVKLTIHSFGYPVPTLTWTGKLPAGLKAKQASGGKLIITGTVSASAVIGTYKITIAAASPIGKATKTITITIKT
jgi:hypothetical protein